MATAVAAADVAVSITHFVSTKVIEGPVSTPWKRTVIAVMWIKVVIHVAEEAMCAMEPRTGSEKDAPVEPLRPVIPVRGAAVWGVVEVAVRANRLRPDIDRDLSRCRARGAQHSESQESKC